jgi:pimeloyl-ACP methyl ester carboxylesterase
MYGGADHVADRSRQDIATCLRCPATLRHILRITRGWFAEEKKLKAALRRLKRVPALLVWGDRDYTVGLNSAIKLKRRLRAAELIVIPGGGHSLFEEIPEAANQTMLEWLARHPWIAPRPRNLPQAAYVAGTTSAPATLPGFSSGLKAASSPQSN